MLGAASPFSAERAVGGQARTRLRLCWFPSLVCRVAEAIGKDESQVSRIVAGDSGIKLADLHAFLATLDLKVVDRSKVCVDRAVFESYRTLAAKAMTEPAALQWEDE